MAGKVSLAQQRTILEEFSTRLLDFTNELKSFSHDYEEAVVSLYEEQGILEEIYVDYKNDYASGIKQSIESILAKINEEHIPFLEKEIDFVSSRQ